jgi:AmmeMemoRadiSam system protein B
MEVAMSTTTTREPAVAGAFYPLTAGALKSQVAEMITADDQQHELLVCIAPHAGYVYSGPVAGKVYGHLQIPRQVLVLGPNHTGLGPIVSVDPHSQWQTPLGPIPVDRDLAAQIIAALPTAESDPQAHWREHSIEVQLPFLQARRPDVSFVPICIKHLSLEECMRLGEALAQVISGCDEAVGVVVSSDMSHYESDEVARALDHKAIDAALTLEPQSLFETVRSNQISMCGVIPATVALAAARHLGASSAHLVDYATSGDTSGDRSAVVGYAGICIQ